MKNLTVLAAALGIIIGSEAYSGNPCGATCVQQKIDAAVKFSVGQYAQGGTVYSVTPDGLHGIVVTNFTINLSNPTTSFSNTTDWLGTTQKGPGSGGPNTNLLRARATQTAPNTPRYLADACVSISTDYAGNLQQEGTVSSYGYADWVVPGRGEVMALVIAQVKGLLANNVYTPVPVNSSIASSSESNSITNSLLETVRNEGFSTQLWNKTTPYTNGQVAKCIRYF